MATYQIQSPDGAVYHIEGPDNADPSAVIAQVAGQHKYGTGQSLDVLANGQTAPSNSPAAAQARSPVSGSDSQNFRAAYGKAAVDLARGAGQYLGLESRQDVADARARDAPLMATKAGKAGAIAGTAADLLPAAFIPGANTLAGASAIGAGAGALMPSTGTGETLMNTGLGALAGPAGLLLGRGAGALYQGGKAALEPLFQGGQQRIAARTLQSFAGGPQAASQAATALAAPRTILPGVQPTTAEVANNAGLAQLQRVLGNNPESLTQLSARQQANDAATRQAVSGIAGTDAQMAAAQAAREAVSKPLYQAAQTASVTADDTLRGLLSRPSMKDAWSRAQQLASERGETLVSGKDVPAGTTNSSVLDASGQPFTTLRPAENATYSGRALQYLKMALQDTANSGPQKGMGAHELAAVKSTLGDLQGWITKNVPALRAADTAFAAGSKPINQMQIGQQLANRLSPALTDFQTSPTRVNANAFANAVRNGDQLAADTTGNARATLSGTLTPQQMGTLNLVGQQLGRRATAADLGRAVGSNTGQNLASQNVLRQFLGPLGLPQSVGERATQSALMQSVLRPFQFVAKAGEPRILDRLTQAALDPKDAAQLLQQAAKNPRIAQMLWDRQRYLGPLANTAAQGLMGSGNAAQ